MRSREYVFCSNPIFCRLWWQFCGLACGFFVPPSSCPKCRKITHQKKLGLRHLAFLLLPFFCQGFFRSLFLKCLLG